MKTVCPCIGATGLYPGVYEVDDVCREEKCSKLGCEWPCKTCALAKFTRIDPEGHPWNDGCLSHKMAMGLLDDLGW